jgi:hypothetical protein
MDDVGQIEKGLPARMNAGVRPQLVGAGGDLTLPE